MRKQLAVVLFSVMTGLITTPAISSGIPVADAAQILGQAGAMMQDIKNYKEYMEQTILNNKELLEAYKQYNQMLEDYKQILREAEGLKDKLSSIDYKNFMDEIALISNQFDPVYGGGVWLKIRVMRRGIMPMSVICCLMAMGLQTKNMPKCWQRYHIRVMTANVPGRCLNIGSAGLLKGFQKMPLLVNCKYN